MYNQGLCVNISHLQGSYLAGMMYGKYEYSDISQVMYPMQGDITYIIETVPLFNVVFYYYTLYAQPTAIDFHDKATQAWGLTL